MIDVTEQLKEHKTRILAYIARRSRNTASIEDVFQETILRIIEQNNKKKIHDPIAYAFRVADSIIFATARKIKLETEIGDMDFECQEPWADEVLEYKQRNVIFQDALRRLSTVRRTIFIKRHLQGKSRQQIATELDMSVEAVKKQLVRAMTEITCAITDREGNDRDNNKKNGAKLG